MKRCPVLLPSECHTLQGDGTLLSGICPVPSSNNRKIWKSCPGSTGHRAAVRKGEWPITLSPVSPWPVLDRTRAWSPQKGESAGEMKPAPRLCFSSDPEELWRPGETAWSLNFFHFKN